MGYEIMADKKKNVKNKVKKETVKEVCEKVLLMKDGRTHKIISEDGRYYHTIDGDFRKINPTIKEIKKVATNANDELTEGE